MSYRGKTLPVLAAIVATWTITSASVTAQSSIPNGVFVRNSEGLVWLILDGQRIKIPVWAATDDEIVAVPVSDRWAVMNADGAIIGGDAPAWLGSQSASAPSVAQQPPPAALAPTAIPTVGPPTSPSKRLGEPTILSAPSGLQVAVTLFRVQDNVRSANQFNTAKGRWVLTEWEVRNEGTTDLRLYRSDFKLQMADGSLVTPGNHAGHPEPDLDTDLLGPGQRTRGHLVYDVPAGRSLSTAIYQPSGARQFVIADLGQ